MNKIGPIQLPWGTPQFRLKSSEVLSPTSIRCLGPDRNESNCFKAVPTTPTILLQDIQKNGMFNGVKSSTKVQKYEKCHFFIIHTH